jgi:hypothetical protein
MSIHEFDRQLLAELTAKLKAAGFIGGTPTSGNGVHE